MQIGVVYPQIELRGDPTAGRRIGSVVEDLGFDHLLAYDHVLGAVHADRTPELTGPGTARAAGVSERRKPARMAGSPQVIESVTREPDTEP